MSEYRPDPPRFNVRAAVLFTSSVDWLTEHNGTVIVEAVLDDDAKRDARAHLRGPNGQRR
jgi:hypothetical protein